MQSIEDIPTEAQCRKLLERIVLGKECRCLFCGGQLKRNKRYYWCKFCRKKIWLKSFTWLRGSKLSYRKIFILVLAWQKKVNPGSVKTLVGLPYKTIDHWFSLFRDHLPREEELLDGLVEVDESYFGKKKFGNQRIVIGAVMRQLRKLRLKIIPNAGQDELEDFIWAVVSPESKLFTDANPGYYDIRSWGYGHEIWNHSRGHFAGTNNIENVWSVIKRQIRRIYGQLRTERLEEFIVEWEARANYPALFTDPLTYLQATLRPFS
jgi:transposase